MSRRARVAVWPAMCRTLVRNVSGSATARSPSKPMSWAHAMRVTAMRVVFSQASLAGASQ